jgi:hypothetical protein
MIIYKTTNLINGKYYVGRHYTSADDGYLGSGKFLKHSILKNGKENFQREILEHVTSANVNEREIFWIAELSATNLKIGYNLTIGGEGVGGIKKFGKDNPNYGNKWTEEQKENLRNKTIGKYIGKNNPNYGNGDKIKGDKNPSKRAEVREKLSKIFKGRLVSKETCDKMSKAKIGKKLSNENRMNRAKWHYKFVNVITNEVLETDSLNILCQQMNWKSATINEAMCKSRKRNKYKDWIIERWANV